MWPGPRRPPSDAREPRSAARRLTASLLAVALTGAIGAGAALGGPLTHRTAAAAIPVRPTVPAPRAAGTRRRRPLGRWSAGGRLPARGVPFRQVVALAPQLQAGAEPPVATGTQGATAATHLPADAGTIAQVRRGQVVLVRRSPGGRVVERLDARSDSGSRPRSFTVYAVAGGRWLGVSVPSLVGRLGWIAANPAHVFVHAALNEISVSLRRRRLVLFQGSRVVLSTPVVIGGPGSPTPPGHFSVDDVLHYRPASPEYGIGALALSVAPRGRSWVYWRVAIHGLNNLGTLGGTGSLGCVHVPTPQLRRLLDVPVGTPVDIVP